ncbi:DUF3310 domain-containing protein [Weissella paramesenteroides]|uniref:DUF3310 domain-containing protein n=1 Tax=Weissella paramesenteroides ATCC 33313 TaxID=585506 RepID=C5R845_WEIPA|nr:DUF3310 domain-containing protein [Weissella paramesenteroides]EER75629.1 hypothetical protein HMPREF0877_0140 [Weissella paramesenteroides ATCC 33313]
MSSFDIIDKPEHYVLSDGTEVKDHINSIVAGMNGSEAWKVANIIKYVSRADKKNGKEDLKKARKYIDLLIDGNDDDKPFMLRTERGKYIGRNKVTDRIEINMNEELAGMLDIDLVWTDDDFPAVEQEYPWINFAAMEKEYI